MTLLIESGTAAHPNLVRYVGHGFSAMGATRVRGFVAMEPSTATTSASSSCAARGRAPASR